MTKNERIKKLEDAVTRLEAEIAVVRANKPFIPVPQPLPPNWWQSAPWYPWQITYTTETSPTLVVH